MDKKKLFIGLAVAGLLVENALAIGLSRYYPSNTKELVITNKNGKSETTAIDAKSIANNYKTKLSIIALKDIIGDNNIDKEVQDQLNANIKALGGEQKFLEQLKSSNMDKNTYTESLEYNLLFNKGLSKIKKVEVSNSEAEKAIKDGSIQVPEKMLKIYSSLNKQSLLDLQDKLNNKDKITLTKDVQDGVIKVGKNNKDFWNVIGNLDDGNCSQLITVGNNNYLIYNISSISKDEQFKDAISNLETQNSAEELNNKIKEECNTFTYSIK